MRLLCAALCAAFFATGAHAVSDMGDKPEWYACEKNADCAFGIGPCSEVVGVNKNFVKEFNQDASRRGAVIDCADQIVSNGKALRAVCVGSRCDVKPKPIYRSAH